MKIRTITCHNVYNYGASLQAHALMYYLEKLGHEVKVIDYMPKYIRNTLSIWYMGKKWRERNIFIRLAFYIYVIPVRLMQNSMRRKFRQYNRIYLKLTKRYNSWEELKNDPPVADIYICGSDQIWNTNINNGLDPAFYCDFAPLGKVRASYAASFSISVLPQKYKHFVQGELEKLNFISVREKVGLDILNNLGIHSGIHVVDPVFLKSKEEWLNMCYMPKWEKYILIYDQENSSVIKQMAISLSKKTKKKIIALKNLYPMSYADIQVKDAGPIDFISLISCADVVITNSFHCSAFSIIMKRDFFVVPRTHQKVNSRMRDLLDYIGVSSHFVSSVKEMEDSASIDYDEVEMKMNVLIKDSVEYIKNILQN